MSAFTLNLTVALLRHYLGQAIGDEALTLLIEEISSLGGDKLKAKLNTLHGTAPFDKTAQLLSVAYEAEECFQREYRDPALRAALATMPLAGTESLQSALANLSGDFDESNLERCITDLFAITWPNLANDKRTDAVRLYLSCLRRALLRIKTYEEKIVSLAVLGISEKVERLEKLINSIANRSGVVSSVVDIIRADEPPVPPQALAPRSTLVQNIVQRLSQVTWFSLIGATGLGKTLLARAVRDRYQSGPTIWITVRDKNRQVAITHIEQQLTQFASVQSESETLRYDAEFQQRVLRGLEQRTLVVLDDIPIIGLKNPLLSYLASFAHLLKKANSVLLSTSQVALPSFISERLGDSLVEIDIPPFDTDDVKSMFDALDAPPTVNNEKIAALICGTNSGHPALVAATISWLQSQQWTLKGKNIERVIAGDPAKKIQEETVRLLPNLLRDATTRNFLYRLSLMAHPFDENLARAIAEIKPSIPLPGEKLAILHGPWLSRTSQNMYEVSALLRNSGATNLSPRLQEKIHATCADKLLASSPIPADQVLNIVLHLFSSHQGDRLAYFIVNALMNVKTKAQADYFAWVTSLFSDDAPKQIDVKPELMVMIRATQIRLKMLSGKGFEKLLADMNDRLKEFDLSKDEHVALALFAYGNTGPFYDYAPIGIGIAHAIKLAHLLEHSSTLVNRFPQPAVPQDVIWFPLLRLKTLEEYELALTVVESLHSSDLVRLVSTALGDETIYIWVDRTWHIVADQSLENRNWGICLKVIARIEQIGLRHNILPFAIAASRAQSIVHADYLKRPETALQILLNASVRQQLNPVEDFILAYTSASILLDASRLEEASKQYERAVSVKTDAFVYYRFDAFRRMAEISGCIGDWGVSAKKCIDAILYGRASAFIPVEDLVEIIGELAWVRWNEGKPKAALGAMYAASMKLVHMDKSNNPRQKETMLKIGHVLGWMAYQTIGKGLPPLTVEGETYVQPFSGMVSRRREQLASLDRPGVEFLLLQLGLFSANLGARRNALAVLKLAGNRAKLHGFQLLSANADLLSKGIAAMFLPPAEVVDMALSAAMCLGIITTHGFSMNEIASSTIDLEQVWSTLPYETRIGAQKNALWTVLGCAVSSLFERNLSNETALTKLNEWEDELASRHFDNRDYWIRVVSSAELIFKPNTGKVAVKAKLDQIDDDDWILRYFLYLGLSTQHDASLVDIAKVQAIAYHFVLDNFSKEMKPGVGMFIVRVWRYISEKRAFYLSNPMRLRKLLAEIHPWPSESEIAKVLQVAADCVGAKYEKKIEDAFTKLIS